MSDLPLAPQFRDVMYIRLRLVFEFFITIAVLSGSFAVFIVPGTSTQADSGAAAVATLVVGYWFGRART